MGSFKVKFCILGEKKFPLLITRKILILRILQLPFRNIINQGRDVRDMLAKDIWHFLKRNRVLMVSYDNYGENVGLKGFYIMFDQFSLCIAATRLKKYA